MKSIVLTNYTKAMLPEHYTILGVRLKEYSLGHYFLMARFDCGFIDDDENRKGDFTDLLLALAICSRTYEEFIEFIKDEKEFNAWTSNWGNEVKKALQKKQINMVAKLLMFKNYMKSGIPKDGDIRYWKSEESEDAKQSGAHWSQVIYTTAVSKLGYTSSEALNLPLSRLMWDYFKYIESEGAVELWRDDEIEQYEALEKMNAKQGETVNG